LQTLPFGVIVASGSLSALPHASPSSRVIKEGDLIVFDWGGEYGGYYSDMTRTVVLKGKDFVKQKEIYSIVLEAQKRAIEAVKSNIKTTAVDAAARSYIKQKGYGENFGHGTGHGVGLAVHEKPYVSWRSKGT
jgi:Xaa-Pro aminopeptidase